MQTHNQGRQAGILYESWAFAQNFAKSGLDSPDSARPFRPPGYILCCSVESWRMQGPKWLNEVKVLLALCWSIVLLWAGPSVSFGQLDIRLNAGSALEADPAALAAFQRAAGNWEAVITSPIRVNIDANLGTFSSPFVIGSTGLGPANPNLDYTMVRNAMAVRASRPGDGILAYLPTTDQISANIPTGSGDTFDKTTIGLTSANQKALGLIANPQTDTGVDGVITFNQNFSFDYDRSDGISPSQIDFETVATHEIGHLLSFLSDTDDYDDFPNISDNVTTLDLFRFNSSQLPTTPAEFTTFPRELRPGQPASFYDLLNAYSMSTGAKGGDGRQASHWKDDAFTGNFIGIMDPSLSSGVSEPITAADLRAMELIGYDTIPEPASMIVLIVQAGFLLLLRPIPYSRRAYAFNRIW